MMNSKYLRLFVSLTLILPWSMSAQSQTYTRGNSTPAPVQANPAGRPRQTPQGSGTNGSSFVTTGTMDQQIQAYELRAQGRVKWTKEPQFLTEIREQKAVQEVANSSENIVRIRIASGSEKMDWLNWALAKWERTNPKTRSGKAIVTVIESVGSIRGGRSIRNGNAERYTVWTPASSVFRGGAENAYRSSVFETDQSLVQSPVVFLTYKDTHDAIQNIVVDANKNPKPMSFNTFVEIYEKENLNDFCLRPVARSRNASPLAPHYVGPLNESTHECDWLKFAMTNPLRSNSGLMGLIISAYEYFSIRQGARFRRITEAHLRDVGFQVYLAFQKTNFDTNSDSTGKLGDTLSQQTRVLDSALLYENEAIEKINALKGRNDRNAFVIHYPRYNLVTDHPYYVIKQNTSEEQREAAKLFMDFLLEKEQQMEAMLRHGFRPSSNEITNQEVDQMFGPYRQYGLTPNVESVSRIIPAQPGLAIEALLSLWEVIEYNE